MLEFAIGIIVGVWVMFKIIKLLFRDSSQQELVNVQDTTVPALVEEINGIFYIYSVEKNEFLAQGINSQEILKHLIARHMPELHVLVVEGEPDVIKRLKSTIAAN